MTDVLRSSVRSRRRLAVPALRLGWSEGDAWTVGIGLVLAVSLAVSTIPAVLDARDRAVRAAAPPVEAPLAPVEPAAPLTPPPEALPLPPPVPQPLFGPLVPFAPDPPHVRDSASAPVPAPDPAPDAAAPAPPAAGVVRRLTALPSDAEPGAVSASADGSAWAGTDAPSRPGAAAELLRWDATGSLQGTAQVPGQPRERTRGLTGVTLLPDGSVAAVDAATSRLLRFDAGSRTWSKLAQVPDVAPCLVLAPGSCQPGLLDTAPLLRGIAVDADGSAYVADAGQGIVWRLRQGSAVEPWYASADFVGEQGVAGLAVDADGHLRAVVTRLADLQGTAAGALLRIERAEDGSAGDRTVVATFRAGDDPVDVALGASGNAYVALRGVHAVATLDSTGFEQLRVVDDALKEPAGVALSAGRLLVAVAAPVPAVLVVGVDDIPLMLASAPSTAGGPTRG